MYDELTAPILHEGSLGLTSGGHRSDAVCEHHKQRSV